MVGVQREAEPEFPPLAVLRERYGLTKREAEVALLLAAGLKNEQVADRLFVSPHTARHHVESVLAKLEVTSRSAVAVRLLRAA
jgi:DNA-binding CsgD family transcriptional regulator